MKNKGIVLKKIDWKSSNIIVGILTEDRYIVRYIVYNAKKKFFAPTPGSLLEFVEDKGKGDLPVLKEWHFLYTPDTKKITFYAIHFITVLLLKYDMEQTSHRYIYSTALQAIHEIEACDIDKTTILIGFLIKFLSCEGVISLELEKCEKCNTKIEKRQAFYYDFENNKNYCIRCDKKGILLRYNSSIPYFINWFVKMEFIDLKGVKLPFLQTEIISFLQNYVDYHFTKMDVFSILGRVFAEETGSDFLIGVAGSDT